jgi:hypothetical protein
MEHTTVEERIKYLERRLQEVEQVPKKETFGSFFRVPLQTSDERARFFGWAITTFSVFGLLTGISSSLPLVGLFFSFGLLVGFMLIASASGLMTSSDSHLQLQQEHRSGKKVHAHRVHHRASIKHMKAVSPWRNEHGLLALGFLLLASLVGWSITLTYSDPLIQIVLPAFLLIFLGVWGAVRRNRFFALGSLGILVVLLSVAADPLLALMSAITGFAVIWIASWENADTDVLAASGFGLALVSLGQSYLSSASFSDAERVAALSAALLGLLLTGLAYASVRRALDRRDLSRSVIVLTPIASLVTLTAVGPYTYTQNLLAGLLITALAYGSMAYVGWLSHGRLSYAKYFLAASLGSLFLFVYLILDAASVSLIWFILAVLVTVAGFTLPSYTVAHYLFLVLGENQIIGPILLRDRVWLGLIMGLFLPALGLWYREAKLTPIETRLAPIINAALSTTGFLIIFAIGYLDIPVPYQSVLWILTAFGAYRYGKFAHLPIVVRGSVGLLILSIVKLVGLDLFSLNTGNQLIGLLILALALISFGLILPKRSNKKGML